MAIGFSLVVASFVAVMPAYADSCGSIIAGASTEAYQGTYGGYDHDGNCHSRDVSSDNECRRLTGNLYIGFSPDHGKILLIVSFNNLLLRVPGNNSLPLRVPGNNLEE